MRRLLLPVAIAAMTVIAAPAFGQANDNDIAQFIMQELKTQQQQGNLRGFNVDLRVEDGTVWLEGYVSDADQENLVLRTAQSAGHLGVVQIVDDIDIKTTASRAATPAPVARNVAFLQDGPVGAGVAQPAAIPQPTPPMPAPRAIANPAVHPPMAHQPPMHRPAPMGGAVPMSAEPMNGPMPIGYSGAGAPLATDHPQMPGYAWPGYAAHPNYAAVTYPKQYSPSAWPYIGPFYPYPQVPLGWRKVTLEWDDGWWYLDFNDR